MSSLLIIQVMIFVSLNNTNVTIRIRPNKNASKISFVGLREVPLIAIPTCCFSHLKISLADFHKNITPIFPLAHSHFSDKLLFISQLRCTMPLKLNSIIDSVIVHRINYQGIITY